MEITGGVAITTEEMLFLGIKGHGTVEQDLLQDLCSLVEGGNQPMATLQKGIRKQNLPPHFLLSSHSPASPLSKPNQQSEGTRAMEKFSAQFSFFFCRNQWQPNMWFLKIPTGLTILLVTLGFSILFKLKSNVHVVL